MGLMRKLDSKVSASIRQALEKLIGPAGPLEILEIYPAILEDVEAQIQPIHRGRRVFPFNHLLIRIVAPKDQRRAAYELVFRDRDELARDIRELLEQAGCAPERRLAVHVLLVEDAGGKPFAMDYRRLEGPPEQAPVQLPPARLAVLRGASAEPRHTIAHPRVNVGRLAEVLDAHQRLIRRNDLVFLDCEDAVNQSVSREHAHILFDEAERSFRLFDDNSACGTRIVRLGQAIPVPPGAQRGIRLMPGDEIYFGQACVRFEIPVS